MLSENTQQAINLLAGFANDFINTLPASTRSVMANAAQNALNQIMHSVALKEQEVKDVESCSDQACGPNA